VRPDTNAPRSAVREAMMLHLHAAHACRRPAGPQDAIRRAEMQFVLT
jgi:hypothetical protein